MSRLFTFGCSYTNYRWSTWADCLAPEFDYFENWGQSGAGNQHIFNSVIEADQRHKFDSNDTVIVCWTTVLRDDRYVQGRWHTLGNMFNCPVYDPNYLKTHVDERGCMIRDFAYIKAVKVLLESKSDLRWRFLSLDNLAVNTTEYNDVIGVYNSVLESILPSYQEVLFPSGWKVAEDPHPSPVEHLTYLDAVLPGWVTKSETRAKIQQESVNLRKNPAMTGLSKVTRL
jgi:hypothetical protein